jgi:hypothetical protein
MAFFLPSDSGEHFKLSLSSIILFIVVIVCTNHFYLKEDIHKLRKGNRVIQYQILIANAASSTTTRHFQVWLHIVATDQHIGGKWRAYSHTYSHCIKFTATGT